MSHRTADELDAALPHLLAAPHGAGPVELIVRRPAVDERELLVEAILDPQVGLVGDTWTERSSRRTVDGSPHPDMQLTLMRSRVAQLLAGSPDRWPLAGDQLYVDLDLGEEALPAGTRLALGSALVEITDQPHTGCSKFAERFGPDALRWVNTPAGRAQRLRGANARIVRRGTVRLGDVASVLLD